MSNLARQLFDDDEENDPGSQYPFWWIVVPIVLAIAIACMVMLIRHRRRQLRRTLAGCNNALRRDLEAMGPLRNRPAGAATAGRPWYRVRPGGSVGYWRGGLGGPCGVLRPHDEGLNEFGEAPPAYSPSGQKEHSDVEEIELGRVGTSQADLPVPPPPPVVTTATPAAGSVPERDGSPPPYNEARQGGHTRPAPELSASTEDGPERPPPAVLDSR